MQSTNPSTTFIQPGDRLSHILDNIGFIGGRGRIKHFFELLISRADYNYTKIKKSTVRAWFYQNAPSLRKIKEILEILSSEYKFNSDIDLLAVWWKVGGYYPYTEGDHLSNDERDFVITSLINEESKLMKSDMDVKELLLIKDKLMQMFKDFSNPNIKEYPEEHARILVKGILHS